MSDAQHNHDAVGIYANCPACDTMIEEDGPHALALIIANHHRLDPPGGKCTCGHETGLGRLFSRHIADEILAAGWSR